MKLPCFWSPIPTMTCNLSQARFPYLWYHHYWSGPDWLRSISKLNIQKGSCKIEKKKKKRVEIQMQVRLLLKITKTSLERTHSPTDVASEEIKEWFWFGHYSWLKKKTKKTIWLKDWFYNFLNNFVFGGAQIWKGTYTFLGTCQYSLLVEATGSFALRHAVTTMRLIHQ